MMDFSTVKSITIPEGSVKKITAGDIVLWQQEPDDANLLPLSADEDVLS